jgi:hypothetical protein
VVPPGDGCLVSAFPAAGRPSEVKRRPENQDEPGDADGWATYQGFLRDGLAYFDPESDGIECEPDDPKQGLRILSRWFNIDNFLAARRLNFDHRSRMRLVEHVALTARGCYGSALLRGPLTFITLSGCSCPTPW